MSSWVITLGDSGLRITRIDDDGLKDYSDRNPESIEITFVGIEPDITLRGRITKVEWNGKTPEEEEARR